MLNQAFYQEIVGDYSGDYTIPIDYSPFLISYSSTIYHSGTKYLQTGYSIGGEVLDHVQGD
ncbi:hypothetical protein SCA6_009069 [Theobroma cacao]